jgi:hypothetical protein
VVLRALDCGELAKQEAGRRTTTDWSSPASSDLYVAERCAIFLERRAPASRSNKGESRDCKCRSEQRGMDAATPRNPVSALRCGRGSIC